MCTISVCEVSVCCNNDHWVLETCCTTRENSLRGVCIAPLVITALMVLSLSLHRDRVTFGDESGWNVWKKCVWTRDRFPSATDGLLMNNLPANKCGMSRTLSRAAHEASRTTRWVSRPPLSCFTPLGSFIWKRRGEMRSHYRGTQEVTPSHLSTGCESPWSLVSMATKRGDGSPRIKRCLISHIVGFMANEK